MGWSRLAIANKIRDLTGTPYTTQMEQSELNTRINNYYVFTMPAELKVQIENNFLDFKTVPGQDVYSFPGGFFTDSPGVYSDGYPCIFYEDPDIFYQDWPQQYAVENIGAGDGVTTGFSGTLQYPPLIIGSLFISDNSQVLQSLADGSFEVNGDGTGTINFTTGAYAINFTSAPPATETIYAKYIGYTGNRPSGCLFFENEFTLRPVPDSVYQMHMQGFIKPDSLEDDSDIPLQEEWGPLIAYGVSLEIFSDRGDLEAYNAHYPMLKRYETVALSRTIQQLGSQQSVPRF